MTTSPGRFSILFVCLGNICRSPAAEAIFCRQIEDCGWAGRFQVDSAGTGDWMVGSAPDPRMVEAATRRGYRLDALRARQLMDEDFFAYDLICAMDRHNLAEIERRRPADVRARTALLMDFAVRNVGASEVPDPYGGGANGFEWVLDLIEDGVAGLLHSLQGELNKVADAD